MSLTYEKQSSYSITIVATSGDETQSLLRRAGRDRQRDVDAEDDGSVSLSQREPQVGRTVIATVSDPDGGVTITNWQWYRGPVLNWTALDCGTDCRSTMKTDVKPTSRLYPRWDGYRADVVIGEPTPDEHDGVRETVGGLRA